MKSDINDLCEAFLAALTNAGYAVKSIENYKQVSNRFKKFCAENGYDTYTVNIGQIFADNVFNEETGAFVGYRNVMYGRFVRLINSFYLQGTFDFSMVTKEKNVADGLFCREIDGLFCRSSPDIIVRRRCVLSHKRRGWLQPSPSFRYSRNLALQDELYHPVINNGPAVLVCVDKRLGTGPVNQSRDAG